MYTVDLVGKRVLPFLERAGNYSGISFSRQSKLQLEFLPRRMAWTSKGPLDKGSQWERDKISRSESPTDSSNKTLGTAASAPPSDE